jgi:AraC-like DNA-binding protein
MQKAFPIYSVGHFINQPHNPTGFEVILFEAMEEPQVEDLHKHTFYEIIWVDSGTSKQTIDYKEYGLVPQSLFFISPGQLHLFEQWEHLKGGSILFTEEFFLLNHQNQDKLFELSFLDNFHANPLLQPSQEHFTEIRHTIELLCKEKVRKDYSQPIAQALLHILVAQIQRCINGTQSRQLSKRSVLVYKELKVLLDVHFMENLSVSDYADKLHLTSHHLNVICKEVTGKTAGEVIRARSLLEAKRLLTHSDISVTEVASTLHFFDLSYFARIFRNETGLSPATFKKSISEKYR